MLNTNDILETIQMITDEHLDVRTVTMGISLLDCADPDGRKACEKIYRKITEKAKDLVKTAEDISATYGMPIVNKRISVTPIAMLLASAPDADPVWYAKTLDAAAKAVGVNFIGGYSALVHKGFSAGDERLIRSIPEALACTDYVCSSINVGSTKSGINMDAVKMMGPVIKEAAARTRDKMCAGAAKLVVFCNAPEDNPFMAGAFHGPGEPDCVIHVGVSGPGAVRAALAQLPKDASLDTVAELIKRTAFKITRMGQLVGNLASERLGVPFGIVDLSLAPTPAPGDSVANILEEIIHVGVSGPGAVRAALAQLPKDASLDTVAELIKRTAFKITRMGQLVGNLASERLGVPFGIVDLSLAPTPAPGDSVANILEEIGLESCGCCGTTATLAMLNDAVKKGGVMASNHVGGLSGAFIPVSEDDGMIKAVERGSLSIEKLEAMTAVCSVGIDMVVIPGETDAAVISALIADEAAIGMVNTKTTAVRVIPAIGCKEGDVLDFGGLLGYAPILPVSTFSPSVFVNRGGRIPAPLQALKN